MIADPDDIPCWQRINARTTTSGRIAARDVDRLAALGVRQVINLALDDSPGGLADEAALMAAAGLRYSQIPVPFDAPDDAHYESFCAALKSSDEPVHVHCTMNRRVSAFFYRYNLEAGMRETDARAIMEQQWSPETSDNEHAAAWARFIART
ncbi:MAG: sulfur transferase domain-containing protein [Novosphingobium sp.]